MNFINIYARAVPLNAPLPLPWQQGWAQLVGQE